MPDVDLTFGSEFSGVGLLDFGLHLAGIKHAWFCERDEFRRGILAQRWPGALVLDDVRTVGADTVPRVDGIVGGFPCKGASTAGKRTGMGHPETVLWREQLRAISELRPRYVLVENVANILTLHDGAVWGEVLGGLAALGMRVVWDCLPAAAVGAPHLRDRVFAVASYADGGSVESGGLWRGERGRDQAAVVDSQGEREQAGVAAREALGRVAGGHLVAAADSDLSRADADAEEGRSRAAARERDCAAADADGARRERDGSVGSVEDGRPDARGGRQAAADAGGGRQHEQPVSDRASAPRGQQLPAGDNLVGRGIRVEWGVYEPAVRRWEAIHGTAPEPLVRRMDDRGAARVERSRLSALGDGVQVQVGYLAGCYIVELERARLMAALRASDAG